MPQLQDSTTPEQSELGKKSKYHPFYNPDKLFAIPRKGKRDEIGVPEQLPFFGFDLWNHYEVSWLNKKGKPIVALAEIIYGCDTPNIIESKSMKLYFNSFNNSTFENENALKAIIKKDIAERVGGIVRVNIFTLPSQDTQKLFSGFHATCIDDLDIDCSSYIVDASLLSVGDEIIEESLYSNLLKSNCMVTNQPDWGTLLIEYRGKKINHEGLLRYLVSFRNHNEFHEQCIERIFMDIMRNCNPEKLIVYGRYTRRGGLDINPYRSNQDIMHESVDNMRLFRQ